MDLMGKKKTKAVGHLTTDPSPTSKQNKTEKGSKHPKTNTKIRETPISTKQIQQNDTNTPHKDIVL